MLYHLINYLEKFYDIPGEQMFLSISFRTGTAFILALFIAMIFGRRIINRLQKMQIGETIRDLGMEDQLKKKGRPQWEVSLSFSPFGADAFLPI